METGELLLDLGQKLGLGRLALDDEGVCQLVFDKDLVVELEASEAGILDLVGTVCATPGEGREALFAELLEANLSGQGTGGATLALDGALEEVVLCRRLETESLDSLAFENALESFVNHLEAWKNRLSDRAASPTSASDGGTFIRP